MQFCYVLSDSATSDALMTYTNGLQTGWGGTLRLQRKNFMHATPVALVEYLDMRSLTGIVRDTSA